MTKRFVVLGGNGFLGARLVRILKSRGHEVTVFDLRAPEVSARVPGVDYREGNFLNLHDIDAALDGGAEAVLHFISTTVPATSIGNVGIEIETNVAPTVRLLDQMVKQGIRRIGFPSSGGTIYGASTHRHREDETPRPTCPYALGKLLIESLLRFYRDQHGVGHQIWRISNPYGDAGRLHQAQGAIDAFLHRIRAGRKVTIWGQGTAVRDFIFVDDAAAAIGKLLETEAAWNEIVNVGTGRGASIAEVLEIIQRTVDRPVQVEHIAAYTGPQHAVLEVEKLRRLIGPPHARDLAEGIREAWQRLSALG
jgi:UDP-glucose 4-epimerase